jgi:LacI family transcriptional regulator
VFNVQCFHRPLQRLSRTRRFCYSPGVPKPDIRLREPRSQVVIQGRSGKPRRVLFVTDFYLENVLAGIVDYAREAGWELDANMRLHGYLPPVADAAGILAMIQTDRVREWLARQQCPVVRMIATPFDLPYPAVEADYRAAGQAGARHLLALGNVHYAFYWQEDQRDSLEALGGFEAELALARRLVHRLNLAAAFPGRKVFEVVREERQRWLASELSRLPRPLAIMSDDDRRGVGLIGACDLAGLRVPEDVTILGCDNHWVEQGMSRIPLSSVDMNFKGLGREAAASLDRIVRGATPPATVIKVPPIGVVARQSTATFITDSPGITAAVIHLREHFREPLRLALLARRAGMSERVFQLEFKRRVGHSAREEIQRARLSCAAGLLRDTALKLEAIATESGFGSATELCRVFADVYGTSPNVWRDRMKSSAPFRG